ncbi:DUF1365 domain-containing protein [Curvibacter sp. CHRR-16]|uniref:DUF1365 domain-containing protein n=1 Tax=Curvibacter sp. CHRR-16 TaxID=2835872 RepID=UPI001BDAEB9C|nr:DUF1365 domain-containing protein [Curvibacter sp. CHRR-16]MBT0569344.1 DUF1365 domain-containing protein [Curvibacter sp. CHRR-16]
MPAAQPLIAFGQVRHRRTRPTGHAFAYPSYFVLLPMRTLAAGAHGRWRPNVRDWLSFYDSDHGLGTPASQGGVLPWLDALLQQHGVVDATGEVWLQCFPRVLGYTFKPVSFWYCHTPSGHLRAVVVEVNNTFGQRHCYLIENPRMGQEYRADKALHVSPFCKVTGHYRFRFMRTQTRNDHAERIVVRIDYHDSSNADAPGTGSPPDDGALIYTSLSGVLEPITRQSLRRALWRYPLMTWGVIARIHWHALLLWIKRVPWFSLPTQTPNNDSSGAPASPSIRTTTARP